MITRFAKNALCAAICLPVAVAAQEDGSKSEQLELDTIIIVGSRVPGRSAEESPVPVDVLTAEDFEQPGTIGGEVGSLLSANIPSFNMPRQSNSDQGDIVRAAQLRGLSPDQVLVLVNGKRRHASAVITSESKLGRGAAAVDFNNIPTSAIERIEVLRDGAAAQYGSDAIAGVINIVLKNSDESGSVSASYGAHLTEFDPTDEDITDGQTGVASFNKGFSLGDGYLNVSGEYRDRSGTNRAGFDQLPTIGFAEFIAPVPESGTPEAAPNDALAGQRNYLVGDGESQDINISYNAGIELASGFELYSFATYSDREAEGANFFRYPVSENNVTSIYPNGFIPIGEANVTDFSWAIGLKGELVGWNVDASLTYGQNTFDDNIKNTINSSLGVASPTSFDRAEYEYAQTVINLDASRGFKIGYMPVNLAAGVEFRLENYETSAGDEASYIAGPVTDGAIGSQGGPGLRPEETVDEERDAYAAFVDAEFNITEDLLVSAALRFEDYDDFGSTTNGKLAGRWEIVDGLALRGAVSSGFRAPSLAQSFFAGSGASFGDGGGLTRTSSLPVSDALAQANGAVELDAEESISRSIGLTYSIDNFSITADYYEIDIDDRIALSETITVTDTPGTEAIRFFTNVVDTETKGVDVVASYTVSDWLFTAAYNKTDTDVVNDPDRTIFGIEETNTFETAAPEYKLILSSTWSTDYLSVLLRATRYGRTQRVFDFGDGFEPTQTYDAMWSVDTDIQVNITDNWNVAVGVNNLLDEYPDESIFDISFFGNLPYDGGVAPQGVNGRFAYLRTSFNF